ncbi:MAG: hypothetical protein C4K48_05755 [Candidatus Thorarchaeota archaeon]|nr:MAG: hypothetical protein C4K48_05755 [Candidatus Thorarchaeota archaeon]
MRGPSLVTMTILFLLPAISGMPMLALVDVDDSVRSSGSAGFADGSLENISVLEDTSVLNGSYADYNFVSEPYMYLGTGWDGFEWFIGRSWFKFNLSEVNTPFFRATMYVYNDLEWAESYADEPIGVYYCGNDSWNESTLTWNLQPAISSGPSDVISSPASPDMFIENNWYGWEVTDDVRMALAGDEILTEVLRQTVEIGTENALDLVAESSHQPQYAAYIEVSFTNPTVVNLTTSGRSGPPLINYIQDSTPAFGWEITDPDLGDYQSGYNVEVWDNEYYNETLLWIATSEEGSGTSIDYAGPPLVNNTTYYWRVKSCDSYGLWSDWAAQSFTYRPLTSVPSYEEPIVRPEIVYVGDEVTAFINVTYFLGVNAVDIQFGGSNHSMTASGDTYSYSWTPTEAGTLNYTIYMVSAIDTFTSVEGSIEVLAVGFGGDTATFLIIIGAAALVGVVVAAILRKRSVPAK